MINAVLFDLDGTLVDSSALQLLREKRKWKECVSRMHETVVYRGLDTAIAWLLERKIAIGVVTSSVSFYAEKMLRHHDIHYDVLVAYHDTVLHKPHPEPFLCALNKLKLEAECVIGIGDGEEDAQAMAAGKIKSFGAGWSCSLAELAQWGEVLEAPQKIVKFLESVRCI